MKCDELKRFNIVGKYSDEETMYEFRPDGECYDADEVDAAIAELKAKLEDAKSTAYAESVDAGMRERRLKRALYKACAEWALSTLSWLDCTDQGNPVKWGEMRRKCLKKAEEYK